MHVDIGISSRSCMFYIMNRWLICELVRLDEIHRLAGMTSILFPAFFLLLLLTASILIAHIPMAVCLTSQIFRKAEDLIRTKVLQASSSSTTPQRGMLEPYFVLAEVY